MINRVKFFIMILTKKKFNNLSESWVKFIIIFGHLTKFLLLKFNEFLK